MIRFYRAFFLPVILVSFASGALSIAPSRARAGDDEITKEETAAKKSAADPRWVAALKDRYKLTDEQVASLQTKGLNNPQIAIVAGLAEKSGKTLDDIVKMRSEQKMGWGQIAHELGVSPSEIGHSVSQIRHDVRQEKRAEKREKREKREERREERRAERKAERSERREKAQ